MGLSHQTFSGMGRTHHGLTITGNIYIIRGGLMTALLLLIAVVVALIWTWEKEC